MTGAGKTAFAEMCILEFRQRYRSGRTFIVVPTLALLDQWYVSLREDLGVPAGEIATYSGESFAPEPKPVNVAVINTARRVLPQLRESSQMFLIVDECHRAASRANAQVLEGNFEATLGMSATPRREHDSGLQSILIPNLGDIIYTYDYKQARSDGVIVPFDIINVSTDFLPPEQSRYARANRSVALAYKRFKDGRISRLDLGRALRRRAKISTAAVRRVPLAARIVEEHRGDRTLIFHESIPAAEKIRDVLDSRGFNVTLYHSRIGPDLRRDNLRLFRKGLFEVLVTCRALDEGANIPEINVGVIASSTASARQRIQRLGRILRPSHGKNTATIYTVYVTDVEEDRLRQEAADLSDVASVTWMRSRDHASPPH